MEISARGWSRDMGTKVLVDLNLVEIEHREDHARTVWYAKPGIFGRAGRIFIAWHQRLRHMGEYRMEMELTGDEILRLFKLRFGTELREWLIDTEGFTLSPELMKRALRSVKLSDVTLADLATMVGEESAAAAKPQETTKPAEFKKLQ